MSKAIPRVRRWRVRYHCNRILLAEITVETINKQFARWLARDHFWATAPRVRCMACNRVTVSLAPKGRA